MGNSHVVVGGVQFKDDIVCPGEEPVPTPSGIGSIDWIYSSSDTPLGIASLGMQDVPGNVLNYLLWFTKTDTVVNADTIKMECVALVDMCGSVHELRALYADGRASFAGPVCVPSYPIGSLPNPIPGAIAYLTDGALGDTLVFSDGTDWFRITAVSPIP